MNKDDYDELDFDDLDSRENSLDFEPQRMDKDVFKQRNDPQKLLQRYKLQLMNCYTRKEEVLDKKGKKKTIFKVHKKKNTYAKANSQGVEDIINYVEKLINSHTVQGNIDSMSDFRHLMRHVSNDLTMHFMTMRREWDVKLNDIDSIIAGAINLIELFLTRTIFNEERKGYGESFKETTNREVRPKDRMSIMQKLGSFMAGKT